jgi:hypothetical protein
MSDKFTNYSFTLPAIAPLPQPGNEPPLPPAPLAEAAITIQSVPQHHQPEVKPSFYDELTARLAQGEQPSEALLDEALKHKSVRSVGLLAYLGIDLDKPDSNGNTRLHKACMAGDAKVVKILLAHGADLHVVNNKSESPIVPAFGLEERKTQHAVLRAIAGVPDGARQIMAHVVHYDRGDILAWLMVENLVSRSQIRYFNLLPEHFLQNLDDSFRRAMNRKDLNTVAHCVDVLCHVIAWNGAAASNAARNQLRDWHKDAGVYQTTIAQTFDHKRDLIHGRHKLQSFEEEITNITPSTVKHGTIDDLVGEVTFRPITEAKDEGSGLH